MLKIISDKVYTNRYGDTWFVSEIASNSFQFHISGEGCMRVGGTPSEIAFIDPSGGPFLDVGSVEIDGHLVTRIVRTSSGWVLMVEE